MYKNLEQVDFYILNDLDEENRLLFITRLVKKAKDIKMKVLIICSDERTKQLIDKFIWEFKDTSFIAHQIFSKPMTLPLPDIIIADINDDLSSMDFKPDILFDLSYEDRDYDIKRVMIITNQQGDILDISRKKYKRYVANGVTPRTHKM